MPEIPRLEKGKLVQSKWRKVGEFKALELSLRTTLLSPLTALPAPWGSSRSLLTLPASDCDPSGWGRDSS